MLFGAALIMLLASAPAFARSRNVSVGNYYFEDATTKDRKRLVVSKGDQIVFTIVQGIFPPHTVEVDELDIHSGAILQGQTYTTPKLDKVGSFLLYCDPHRERGHVSRLIVEASAPSGAVAATASPRATRGAGASPGTVATTAVPLPTTTPSTMATPLTLEPLTVPDVEREDLPSGIGQADPDVLAQAPIDEDSLDGLLGRTVGGTQPWTRAIRWLALATVPIVGAAVFALRRHAQLSAAAAKAAATKKRKPPRRKKS